MSLTINYEEVARKRAILASARLQFSPELQEVREQAIDLCVEHLLFGLDCEEGIGFDDAVRLLTSQFGAASSFVRLGELATSLSRLQARGGVVVLETDRYRLSASRREDLALTERAAKNRLNSVASVLFPNVGQRFSEYREAFYEVLSIVFSELGQAYVHVLTGRSSKADLNKAASVETALRYVRKSRKNLDQGVLAAAIRRFFEIPNPDFDALKWNLAQNYYISKSLGLDNGAQLLTRELFGGSNVLLDTNVLLHAVDADSSRHETFKTLAEICSVLGVDLQVAQISIDEARCVAAAARTTANKVHDVIPGNLAARIDNIFYRAYLRGGESLDEFFSRFDNLGERLKTFGVDVVDDVWFSDPNNTRMFEAVRDQIRKDTAARKPRPKTYRAAMHDAQLLTWAAREAASGDKVIIVTLDRSLRFADAGASTAQVISLDAMLQWLSPIAVTTSFDFSRIFAESIKYQILPAENFFDLEDFIVFAEMEWDCKVLPPEDVEACLATIKASAGQLDPRSAADREKLARRVRKFFANPGRKLTEQKHEFEAKILQFEQKNGELQETHRSELLSHSEHLAQVSTLLATLRTEVGELRSAVANRDTAIGELSRTRDLLAISLAQWRRGVAAGTWLVILATVLWIAATFGDGNNLWQKVASSWSIAGPIMVAATYAASKMAGRRGLGIFGEKATHVLSNFGQQRPAEMAHGPEVLAPGFLPIAEVGSDASRESEQPRIAAIR